MEWKKVVEDLNKNVSSRYDQGVDSLLDRMGLEQKRTAMDVIVPMLGVFGAGIAVGATLGVLFAPKRGDEFRHEIKQSLEDLRHKTQKTAEEADESASDTVSELRGDT